MAAYVRLRRTERAIRLAVDEERDRGFACWLACLVLSAFYSDTAQPTAESYINIVGHGFEGAEGFGGEGGRESERGVF